jgi:hypothetical protein
VAIYEVYAGLPSCGCFGLLRVSPKITAGFDLLSIGLLSIAWPRRLRPSQGHGGKSRWTLVVIAAVAASGALWARFAADTMLRLTGSATINDLSAREPASWVNGRFPLFEEIEGWEPLEHGRWLVVFYHYDSAACRKAIGPYEDLVAGSDDENDCDLCRAMNAGDHSRLSVAFVAMPPAAPEGKDPVVISQTSSYVRLSLRPDRHWFDATPVVAALEDGKVLAVIEGEAGVEPPNIPQWHK